MVQQVHVEGLAALERQLLQIENRNTRKSLLRRVLKRSAKPMEVDAAHLAPDDPATPAPDLKTSIETRSGRRTRRDPNLVSVHTGPTSAGYPQAMQQEFGNVNHPAQPYMRPAWEQNKMKILDSIKDDLSTSIARSIERQSLRHARQS